MGITIDVNFKGLLTKQKAKFLDDAGKLEITNLFAKMCNDYVPMDEGILSQTVVVEPERIRYTAPYAHYMYVGEVYGPNIPIVQDGMIVGWFSPPGQKKNPTGRSIVYSTEKHPLATKEWDKAMLRDKGDEFYEKAKEIVVRRYNERIK